MVAMLDWLRSFTKGDIVRVPVPVCFQAFRPDAVWQDEEYGTIELEQQSVGKLELPSGQVVVGDLLVDSCTIPLAVRVAAGSDPMRLASGNFPSGDRVIAARFGHRL